MADHVDPLTFRRLLGSFATGVTVVTARETGGSPAGMTASAVAAVSIDPPLLLVCVRTDTDFHGVLAAAETFALNVLAENQEDLSQRFAGDYATRFQGVAHGGTPEGPPLLDAVAAHILCVPWKTLDAGDHTVFFGLVTGGESFDRRPLVHFRSLYAVTRPSRSR